MRIVRIYGVGRSGSTVIGAYLAGRFPNAIHIGEAIRFDRPEVIEAVPTCSCGLFIKECDFWKNIKKNSYVQALESMVATGDD